MARELSVIVLKWKPIPVARPVDIKREFGLVIDIIAAYLEVLFQKAKSSRRLFLNSGMRNRNSKRRSKVVTILYQFQQKIQI